MKKLLFMMFISLSLSTLGQSPQSVEEIKQIIEKYEPCNNLFCFEYKVDYNAEASILEIESPTWLKFSLA